MELKGLQAKPELNGQRGVVVGAIDAASGRYPVQLEDGRGPFSLKPENLRAIAGGTAGDASPAASAAGKEPEQTEGSVQEAIGEVAGSEGEGITTAVSSSISAPPPPPPRPSLDAAVKSMRRFLDDEAGASEAALFAIPSGEGSSLPDAFRRFMDDPDADFEGDGLMVLDVKPAAPSSKAAAKTAAAGGAPGVAAGKNDAAVICIDDDDDDDD